MRRGDLVTVALQGDFGKPRPALVVSADAFVNSPMVVICPISSAVGSGLDPLRISIMPTDQNGLRKPSQIAVHRIIGAQRTKVGAVIGRADDATLAEVNRALAVYLGIV